MSLRNTDTQYGCVTKTLHWIVMILVISMLIAGFFMGDIPSKPIKGQVYTLHKLIGLFLLCIGIVFLFWSKTGSKPKYPAEMKCWEKGLAKLIQICLFIVLIGMPLAGWTLSSAAGYYPSFFGLFEIPMPWIPKSEALKNTAGDMHYYFAWTFVVLISIHALGALKHHFIDKNDVLKRMMR